MSGAQLESPSAPLLQLDHVKVSRDKQAVLHSVSLSYEAGSVWALLGRNGSGRTTLAEAIVGLLPIDAGTILVNGEAIHTMPTHRRVRAGCRLVRDRGNLFPNMTVRENLALCGAHPESDAAEYAACLPRFRALLDRKAGTLSGGEKRIIAIVSAITAGPRVLIVDEFTEGLHPIALDALSEKLARFAAEGKVALLMVHSFDAVQKFAFRQAELLGGTLSAR